MKRLSLFISFLVLSVHATFLFAADNVAPSAVSEVVKTAVGKAVVIDVLVNDFDSDGTIDSSTLVVVRQPSYGTVNVNADLGIITYTPNASYQGPDNFDYQICDNEGACSAATVTILIESSVLIINNDRLGTVYRSEGGVFSSVLSNDLYQGNPINRSDVILTVTSPSVDPSVYIDLVSGDVIVGAGVPEQSYQIGYEVCLVQSPHICSDAVASIKVIHRAPKLVVDSVTTVGNQPISFGVLDNDTGVDGTIDSTTLKIASQPKNGKVTVDITTGMFTYTPSRYFKTNDTFKYRICDDLGGCSVGTVYINAEQFNFEAVNDTVGPAYGYYGALFNSVLLNDTLETIAPKSSDVKIKVLSTPSSASLYLDTISGTVNVAAGSLDGIYKITYEICDVARPYICDSATAVITLIQLPPMINPDTVTTIENRPVEINVILNDMDLDGNIDTTSLKVVTTPVNGTIKQDTLSGILTYLPFPNFNGADSFTYSVSDNKGAYDTALVSIVIEPHNLVAVDDTFGPVYGYYGALFSSVLGNDSLNSTLLLSNDVKLSVLSNPSNASIKLDTLTGEINVATGTKEGVYEISYQICELARPYICDSAKASITLIQLPPVANADTVKTILDKPVNIAVLQNDVDYDGTIDIASLKVVTAPTNGTLKQDTVTGILTYTPTPDFIGADSFTYSVCDNNGECDTAMVSIAIEAHNMNANNDAFGPVYGYYGIQFGSVLLNDSLAGIVADSSRVILSVISPASDAGVYLNLSNGAVNVTPGTPDAIYEISYKVCEAVRTYNCDSAIAIITVEQLAPVANSDTARTIENVSVSISVLANDIDLDGTLDVNSVVEVVAPSNGTLYFDGLNGEITYVPNPNFNGTDSFVYSVCDDKGACDTARVSIVIEPHDLVAEDDTYGPFYGFDGAHFSNVLDNDKLENEGVDFNNVTLSVKTPASNPKVYLDPTTGEVTVDEETDEGIYTIVYEICQVTRPHICDTATITILVTNDCTFLMPEIFSPNGDGIQDVFHIRCIEQYPDAEIEIFNRWGNKVYGKKHYGNMDVWGRTDAWWDGTSNNGAGVGGEVLASGTYFYVLKLNDSSSPRKGYIFLNR